jgi:hypothetical protein
VFSIAFPQYTPNYFCYQQHSSLVLEFSAATLCFHRHSRFVRSFFGVEKLRAESRGANSARPRLPFELAVVLGPRLLGFSALRLLNSLTPLLCFHRHSRFVRSFFEVESQGPHNGVPDCRSAPFSDSTLLLLNPLTPLLCFHRHSRFVRSISQFLSMRNAGYSRDHPRPGRKAHPSGLR